MFVTIATGISGEFSEPANLPKKICGEQAFRDAQANIFQVISFRYHHILLNAFHRVNSKMQSQSPAASVLSSALTKLTQVIPSLILMKQSASVS